MEFLNSVNFDSKLSTHKPKDPISNGFSIRRLHLTNYGTPAFFISHSRKYWVFVFSPYRDAFANISCQSNKNHQEKSELFSKTTTNSSTADEHPNQEWKSLLENSSELNDSYELIAVVFVSS